MKILKIVSNGAGGDESEGFDLHPTSAWTPIYAFLQVSREILSFTFL